ncbi:DNA-binding transcriptional regulator, GntR family [Pseudoxanthobacter soli DSM 19599]|uniref:DNA-binding transcriptional regulator, GntR family n=1 Tax=Pseudoxanthobacter soli DSM 19599 TaxID=1123029 RepID=A0A1M7ZHP8_9HYPH|nr:GntR family transcriptional regulator [Pseudoxanthobacter soli]SHO64430.1 DNA-binding transcriptional regulator, GntR family [Pseudoxanthobacter soli DSM 19599]
MTSEPASEPKRLRQRHLDLAHRVIEVARESGMQAGEHLPEQLIASRCNVSRTPIRKAFQILAEQGLVAASEEGGYRLAVDPAQFAGMEPPLPESDEDALYEAILRDLAARRIAEGQTVAALQRRYGVSRVTVQNTLQRLIEEQLVERAAGQQWIFKPVGTTGEAMAHSFEFRLLMEPAAILCPSFRADPTVIAGLRQTMEALIAGGERAFDRRLFERSDDEFHGMVARSCGNPFIEEALLNHHRRRRTGQPHASVNVFRLMQSTREHLQILEQIEREQMELAADLMRVHLRLSRTLRPRILGRGVPPPLRLVGA